MRYEYTVQTQRTVVERTEWTISSDTLLDYDDLDTIVLDGKRPAGVEVEASVIADDARDEREQILDITSDHLL